MCNPETLSGLRHDDSFPDTCPVTRAHYGEQAIIDVRRSEPE